MIVTTTNRLQPPAGNVLRVAGEVDTCAAADLREHLRRLPLGADGALVVDLSAVTFMSCTALRVLAEAQTRLGPRLVLGGRSRIVTRLLEVTGLSSYFSLLDRSGVAAGEPAGPVPEPLRTGETTAWTFSRTDVHRARGLLMAVHGCDAEEAWRKLASAAAQHGVPVGALVELLVRPSPEDAAVPSSAAAVATLTVLMRQPPDDARPSGAAAGPDRPAERLTNI